MTKIAIMGLPTVSKNEFLRNVFVLFKGNAIAQAITLISIPILTRIYSPEEFGAIALFIGMVNVFAVAATGGYDMAIVLPKRNGQAFHLLAGSIVISFLCALLSLVIILIFYHPITGAFKVETYKTIIWLLPLSVFLAGTHRSLYCWFNRKRLFGLMGANRVVQNTGQTGVRLFRGAFTNGHWGLAAGFLVGLVMAWAMFVQQLFKKEAWRLRYISLKSTLKALREYRNFPQYLMPMGVLNSISVYILIFGLSLITTGTVVGHYERAWRVINFPLSLISASFGSVFFEKMNRSNNRQKFYLYSYFGNLAIAIVILSPVAIWGEDIFGFVLGHDWRIAGKMAQVILPLTAFSFATECVSTIFSVIKKNQLLLIWQIIYLLIAVGWITFARDFDIYFTLKIFSLGGAILYAMLAFIGYLELKKATNYSSDGKA